MKERQTCPYDLGTDALPFLTSVAVRDASATGGPGFLRGNHMRSTRYTFFRASPPFTCSISE
eukprot:27776-Eustigmatos_ZCMA.PRE.1